MSELDVWCVCVGNKYHTGYVKALQQAVRDNLTIPHSFKCITTHDIIGVHCILPYVPYQSWWSKMNLFAPGMAARPAIYLDLDSVIVGNLDYLAEHTDTFSAVENWAQSGHGGIQSSVMTWPGNWHLPYEVIKEHWVTRKDLPSGHTEIDGKAVWGDQGFLWDLLGDNWGKIPHVGSYKYHIRPEGKIPEWMKIACFHGKPDPHEVNDQCLLPYTTILNSLIK